MSRKSMDKIDHDTIAKYLFTSGSTGMPKGVIQTHGMMCAVIAAQEALAHRGTAIRTRFRRASNGCRGTTFPPAISASTTR